MEPLIATRLQTNSFFNHDVLSQVFIYTHVKQVHSFIFERGKVGGRLSILPIKGERGGAVPTKFQKMSVNLRKTSTSNELGVGGWEL